METKKAVFYILPDANQKSRDLYICRLVEKAYQNNKKIFINLNLAEEAPILDTQLWTFRDISFIPHAVYNSADKLKTLHCALLGFQVAPPDDYNEVLVNLAAEIPNFCNNFQHIIEVILAEDNAKNLGRKKYKIYQQNGFTMESHVL